MLCKRGYFGEFCNNTCPLGLYGDDCAGHCLPTCPLEDCNHVYGCILSTSVSPTTKTEPIQTSNSDLRELVTNTLQHLKKITETTQLNLKGSLKTSCTSPVHAEKSTMFVNTKPVIESNANTLYFIVGFGTIVSLLLLTVIVIQLCQKSSKSKREYLDIKTNIHDDTLREIQQINQQAYSTLSEPTRNNVLYHSVEVYSEIDEDLLRPEMTYSNLSEDYEETDLDTSSKELPYRSTVLSDRHTENDSDIHGIYLTPLAS